MLKLMIKLMIKIDLLVSTKTFFVNIIYVITCKEYWEGPIAILCYCTLETKVTQYGSCSGPGACVWLTNPLH